MTYSIAIHGGAGLTCPEDLGQEREELAREALAKALNAGNKILSAGGSAMDACIAAVAIMEDDPRFNAGRGSVLAADGTVRMDASVMDGATREAGAVCGISTVRYAAELARKIMKRTPHVMLYGEDALAFAKDENMILESENWFITPYRTEQLEEAKSANCIILDHEKASKGRPKGTVGAVACDQFGNVAAATSTGGLCNKRPGRVGDSAIIGAGTYADNKTCAVSATGHGELFIRSHVAGRLSDLIEMKGLDVVQAAKHIVFSELDEDVGGLIAVDSNGQITLPFNTGGMFRGWQIANEKPVVAVWRNE